MRLRVLTALAVILALPVATPASVHLMQIQKVIGGVEGDTAAQAIQLRMRAVGQSQLQRGVLVVVDATGGNPVTLSSPASAVANGAARSTVLFATAAFASHTSPAAVPDFSMSAIPQSYLAAGSLTFEDATFGTIYWRVSWGGVAYTGPTTGALTNDADGQFSPGVPGAVPSQGLTTLELNIAGTALSTNNAANYSVSAGAATFTNNAGTIFTVESVATAAPVPLRSAVVLHPAFPNPFNPNTKLDFELSTGGYATVQVFSVDGVLVAELFAGSVSSGRHSVQWLGTDRAGRNVASGVYLVRLQSAGDAATRSVTLIK